MALLVGANTVTGRFGLGSWSPNPVSDQRTGQEEEIRLGRQHPWSTRPVSRNSHHMYTACAAVRISAGIHTAECHPCASRGSVQRSCNG